MILTGEVVKSIHHAVCGEDRQAEARKMPNLAGPMGSLLSEKVLEMICRIGGLADQNGLPAYLAGGFVRDLLRGVPNLDLDFVVEGDSLAFAADLAKLLPGRLIRHDEFFTASIALADGWKIDLAAARTESYPTPGSLPQVAPAKLSDDLFRRDFSVNAMAMAINRQNFAQLIDLYNGREDLALRQIRVLHQGSFFGRSDPDHPGGAVCGALRLYLGKRHCGPGQGSGGRTRPAFGFSAPDQRGTAGCFSGNWRWGSPSQ